MWSAVIFLSFLFCVYGHKTYFYETFSDESSINSWVQSKHNGEKQGEFVISAGKDPVDSKECLGLQTPEDARFYGISKKFEEPFSNKEKPLVIQFTVKLGPKSECGGAYLKVLGSNFDQGDFHGETDYKIMFGPDMCGTMKKVHVIFNNKGKNHLVKKEIDCKSDEQTHLYTLIVTPDNQYEVKIDNEQVEKGGLDTDFDIIPPKKIKDPNDIKPSDWVDEKQMDDPEDRKPDDWDQPEKIDDKNAKKPDDWDDSLDGDWVPPQIDNPDYKGEWKPKKIDNPKYVGPWIQKEIDNPDYVYDPNVYAYDDIGAVGIDIWVVQSGSVFDNILITDSADFAKEEGERIWRKIHDLEVEAAKKVEDKPVTDESSDSEDKEDIKEEDHDEL